MVDSDPLLEGHPLLLDELRVVFNPEDEEFLFKN